MPLGRMPNRPQSTLSLAGQFLIASPEMGDPRFQRTVILLVEHNQRGALGIVVNRPVGERPLASVLNSLGEKTTGIEGTARVFWGGPVQPQAGFVVHSAEYRRAGTIDIDGHVAMTSSLEILRDIAKQWPQEVSSCLWLCRLGTRSVGGRTRLEAGLRRQQTPSSYSTMTGKRYGKRPWHVARGIFEACPAPPRAAWARRSSPAIARCWTLFAEA